MSIILDRLGDSGGGGGTTGNVFLTANLDLGAAYTIHVPVPGAGRVVKAHIAKNGATLATAETVTLSNFGGTAMTNGVLTFAIGAGNKTNVVVYPTSNNTFGIEQSIQVTTDGGGTESDEAVLLLEYELNEVQPITYGNLLFVDLGAADEIRTIDITIGEADLTNDSPLATPFDLSGWTGVGDMDYSPTTGKAYIAGVTGGQSELWELDPDGSNAQLIDSTASTSTTAHHVVVSEATNQIFWGDGSVYRSINFDGTGAGAAFASNPISANSSRFGCDGTYLYRYFNGLGSPDPLRRYELADGSNTVDLDVITSAPNSALVGTDVTGVYFNDTNGPYLLLSTADHTVRTTLVDLGAEGIPAGMSNILGAKGSGFVWFVADVPTDYELWRIPETDDPAVASAGLTFIMRLENPTADKFCLVP